MITGESIGSKYGESIENFSKAAENTVVDILRIWCNQGIELMSKKIQQKARTKGASTLAQSMVLTPEEITATSVSIGIKAGKDATYWKFVDKGVKGVKNKSKAPQSPYSFKSIGASKDMVDSFKKYIARTGAKSYKVGGKRKSLYKTNRKTKEKTFRTERADEVAKSLAVATKIGGIKPMNFVREADNKKRVKQLVNEVAKGLGATIKVSIKRAVNEYNSK